MLTLHRVSTQQLVQNQHILLNPPYHRHTHLCSTSPILNKPKYDPMYTHTLSTDYFDKELYQSYFYSWIARPVQLHKKSICQKSERVTKNPRPPLESSREDASKWRGSLFLKLFFGVLFFLTLQKMTFQKDSPPF